MCWPTVALVHFATPGLAFDQPSTADLFLVSDDLSSKHSTLGVYLPNSITLNMAQLFIIAILVQINTSPTPKQSQSSIDRTQATIILELLQRLLLSPTNNRTKKGQELDTLRVTTKLTLRELANLSHILGYNGRAVTSHEDCLRMLSSEGLTGLGCPGLQNDWCALRAWLGEMRSWYVKVLAVVVDLADARGLSVDSAFAITNDCILAPGGLPEFVCYLDVFFCYGVAVIVLVFGSAGYWVTS